MTRPITFAAILALAAGMVAFPAHAQERLQQAINPPGLPDSLPYGYSQATVVPPGVRMVFVAGQVGVDLNGPNDFRTQVDRAFDNLRLALEASGASPRDVVRITLLVVDHDQERLAYLGTRRREFFGTAPPASTLIPVARLYTDGVAFEIDAVAVTPAR